MQNTHWPTLQSWYIYPHVGFLGTKSQGQRVNFGRKKQLCKALKKRHEFHDKEFWVCSGFQAHSPQSWNHNITTCSICKETHVSASFFRDPWHHRDPTCGSIPRIFKGCFSMTLRAIWQGWRKVQERIVWEKWITQLLPWCWCCWWQWRWNAHYL